MGQTVREVLLSMGYREERTGHWLKPIGHHVFTFNEEHKEWINWFKSASTNDILTMESHVWVDMNDGEAFFIELRQWEAYTNITAGDHTADFRISAVDI